MPVLEREKTLLEKKVDFMNKSLDLGLPAIRFQIEYPQDGLLYPVWTPTGGFRLCYLEYLRRQPHGDRHLAGPIENPQEQGETTLPILLYRLNEANRMPIGTWSWDLFEDTVEKLPDRPDENFVPPHIDIQAQQMLQEILGDIATE